MAALDVSKLKVTELRSELSNRSLSTKGKKDELVARLTEALSAEKADSQQTAEPKESNDEEPVKESNETEKEKESTNDLTKETADIAVEDSTEVAIKESTKGEPVKESTEGAVEESTKEEQVKESTEQPVEESTEQPVKESTEQTVEESTEQPVKESNEQPVKESTEGTVKESTKESVKESPKEEAKQSPKETAKVSPKVTEESTKEKETDVKKVTNAVIEQPNEEINKVVKEDKMEDVSLKRKRSDEKVVEEKRPKTESGIDSSALYVKGFIRPLILKNAQELFAKYGTVKRFWMDAIKTHAYAIYETVEQAREAYKNIHGIQFPLDTGKKLIAGGLTPEEAEKLIEYEQNAQTTRTKIDFEDVIEKMKSGQGLPVSEGYGRKSRSIGIGQLARELAQTTAPVVQAREEKQQERKELSLNDLFRKTEALPQLYYLPNTDEEAKIRLNKIINN